MNCKSIAVGNGRAVIFSYSTTSLEKENGRLGRFGVEKNNDDGGSL
jgi:hypothetical protein